MLVKSKPKLGSTIVLLNVLTGLSYNSSVHDLLILLFMLALYYHVFFFVSSNVLNSKELQTISSKKNKGTYTSPKILTDDLHEQLIKVLL